MVLPPPSSETRHIIQLDKEGHIIHEHAYESTLGTPLDLTFDGESTFYVGNDDGTLSAIRVHGQGSEEELLPEGGPNNDDVSAITWIGGGRMILGMKVGPNIEIWLASIGGQSIQLIRRLRAESFILNRGATCYREVPKLAFSRQSLWRRAKPRIFALGFIQDKGSASSRIAVWNIDKRSRTSQLGPHNHLDNTTDNSWNFGQENVEGRGITHDSHNLWRLVQDDSKQALILYTPHRRNWSEAEDIDISGSVGGTTRGLTHDGRYLYMLRS